MAALGWPELPAARVAAGRDHQRSKASSLVTRLLGVKARALLTTMVFVLPMSTTKIRVLRLLGHDVHPTAKIGPNLLYGTTTLRLGAGSGILFGNVFRNLRLLELGEGSTIGQFNWITSQPAFWDRGETYGLLQVGRHTHVLSRHIMDCTAGILIGSFSTVAGYRSQFITHQIDFRANKVTFDSITVGDYCLLSSANRLVKGSCVPSYSVTGIGTVVLPGLVEERCLYVGAPARLKAKLDDAAYFERTTGEVLP